MKIDQIHFYVENASRWRNWFTSQMGFKQVGPPTHYHNTCIEVVKSGEAEFLLYSPQGNDNPVAAYLKQHPPGVAAVTFHICDLEKQLQQMPVEDATLLQPLQTIETEQGCLKWCQIAGITGLVHTLVERQGQTPLLPWLPDWVQKSSSSSPAGLYFTGIDHLVLNVGAGDLSPTVRWYEQVFGWQRKQTFSIQTSYSGLHSQVLVAPSGQVQFPINEPSSGNSQIQEFIDFNRGAGIQHIALSTPNITEATLALKELGVSFLSVPDSYYTQLRQRFPELPFSQPEWEKIQQAQVLVDCEANQTTQSSTTDLAIPLLLQIFTQPIFDEPTFFFELIERRHQAQGFGEGNFRALFEAIEREQQQR
jgi:4-hydroxyphenylpyruvate dioxygenase